MRKLTEYILSEEEIIFDTVNYKELKETISKKIDDVFKQPLVTKITVKFNKQNKTLTKNIDKLVQELKLENQPLVYNSAYLFVFDLDSENPEVLRTQKLNDKFFNKFQLENERIKAINTKIDSGFNMEIKHLDLKPVQTKSLVTTLDYLIKLGTEHNDYVTNNIYDKDRANLDFDVPFQREYVWNLEQKQNLILSILNKMPIGLFYRNTFNIYYESDRLGVSTKELSELSNILYDGKQRLSSIISFVLNEFPIVVDGEEYYFGNLPAENKSDILSTNISIVETNFTDLNSLIDYYILINTSQTRHSFEDIEQALKYKK